MLATWSTHSCPVGHNEPVNGLPLIVHQPGEEFWLWAALSPTEMGWVTPESRGGSDIQVEKFIVEKYDMKDGSCRRARLIRFYYKCALHSAQYRK